MDGNGFRGPRSHLNVSFRIYIISEFVYLLRNILLFIPNHDDNIQVEYKRILNTRNTLEVNVIRLIFKE